MRKMLLVLLAAAAAWFGQDGLHVLAQAVEDAVPSLVKPKGRYPVGQILLDWTDTSREEPATEDPNDRRQLPVQIWYPAAENVDGEKAHYKPRIEAFREEWGDEAVDFFNAVETTWILDAPPSNDGPFPIFVFSHGWGARSSSHGTFLSDLASHGYVVFGLNHPYLGKVALADGSITQPDDSQFDDHGDAETHYADDVIFALDQIAGLGRDQGNYSFKGILDMKRVAAGGHSSGFPAVVGAAVRDGRIRALISFDAGVPRLARRVGLDQPILLFRADTGSYTDLFVRGEDVNPKGTIYDVNFFRVYRGDFYDLVISGTTHNSVYDEYLFAETDDERMLSIRNHELISRYTVAFLEFVLNGKDTTLLDEKAGTTPDATLRVFPAMRIEK